MSRPHILCVAGSDPSGHAGIQLDLRALHSAGASTAAAITLLTAQSAERVFSVLPIEAEFIAEQIRHAADHVDAVKIGAFCDSPIKWWSALKELRAPIVLDPVLASTSGTAFARPDQILPFAEDIALLTPNLNEAKLLCTEPTNANAWADLGFRAVLVKGGHSDENVCTDRLFENGALSGEYTRPRLPGSPRGTGCALSSLLAFELGRGATVDQAAKRAGDRLHDEIRKSSGLRLSFFA